MDSKIFILTFCVILAVINFQPTAAVDSDAYTEYRTAFDKLTDIPAKVEYLTTTGTPLVTETPFNKVKGAAINRLIGEFLAANPTGITTAQRTALNQLYANLGLKIVTPEVITELVVLINVQERPLPEVTKTSVREIIHNNDPNIAYKIFEAAIDQLYRLQSPLQISDFLRSIEKKDDTIDVFLFNVQMYLYNRYDQFRIKDEYMLYFAHYLYEVKTIRIVNLTNIETRKLNTAIPTLPPTLRTLFFSKEACLRNSNNSEYLYVFAGEPFDITRRYVYTFPTGTGIIGSGRFNTTFSRSMTTSTIQGRLRGESNNYYLYRGSNDIIFASTNTSPNRVPNNSLWSLSLNENKLSFNQDDYYICGSELFKNGNRRIVEAAKYSAAVVPTECEWNIVTCENIK